MVCELEMFVLLTLLFVFFRPEKYQACLEKQESGNYY